MIPVKAFRSWNFQDFATGHKQACWLLEVDASAGKALIALDYSDSPYPLASHGTIEEVPLYTVRVDIDALMPSNELAKAREIIEHYSEVHDRFGDDPASAYLHDHPR